MTIVNLTSAQLALLAWVAIAGDWRSGAHWKTRAALLDLVEFKGAQHYSKTGRWHVVRPEAMELLDDVELWRAHLALTSNGWAYVGGGRRNSCRYERPGPDDGRWVLELRPDGSGWWGYRAQGDHRPGPGDNARHVRPGVHTFDRNWTVISQD